MNQGGDRISQASHSDLEEDRQPGLLTMIGLVALVVAIVILVFFGIGYLFGRVFL